jgi:hypothetical protein
VPSVPPRNLRPGFETQTRKPATDGFEAQTTTRSRVAYSICFPRHLTRVTAVLDRLPAKSSEPCSTYTSSVLTRSTQSLPCTLASVDVPDVSHRGWSSGLLVPQSKPHIRPSQLSVRRHGISLLDLHLTVFHRLRAPHLHTTSQETCRITQLMPWLVTNST